MVSRQGSPKPGAGSPPLDPAGWRSAYATPFLGAAGGRSGRQRARQPPRDLPAQQGVGSLAARRSPQTPRTPGRRGSRLAPLSRRRDGFDPACWPLSCLGREATARLAVLTEIGPRAWRAVRSADPGGWAARHGPLGQRRARARSATAGRSRAAPAAPELDHGGASFRTSEPGRRWTPRALRKRPRQLALGRAPGADEGFEQARARRLWARPAGPGWVLMEGAKADARRCAPIAGQGPAPVRSFGPGRPCGPPPRSACGAPVPLSPGPGTLVPFGRMSGDAPHLGAWAGRSIFA